jgi:uncharacterized membrane protein (GlpM family)
MIYDSMLRTTNVFSVSSFIVYIIYLHVSRMHMYECVNLGAIKFIMSHGSK